jgi:type III secretion protein T
VQALEGLKGFEVYIIAISLAAARMGGMIMMMPVFTRLGLTGSIRGGVALVFALPLLPIIVNAINMPTLGMSQLMVVLLKEVGVGMIIGVVLGVPIWAAEAAGEILDLQRGVTFAELIDPSYTTTNNILGTMFALIIIALYFIAGGLAITLRTIYESYALWPLMNFTPMFNAESGRVILALLDDIAGLGLMLIAPIVLTMLLADLSLSLVARAAPHLNIFVLSLPVKNFALVLLLVLYCAFMMNYMKDDLAWLVDGRARLELIAPRSTP